MTTSRAKDFQNDLISKTRQVAPKQNHKHYNYWTIFLMFTIHCKKEIRKETWPIGINWRKQISVSKAWNLTQDYHTFQGHQHPWELKLRSKGEVRGKVLTKNTVGCQVVSYPLPSAEVGVCTTLVCCPGTGALALLIRRSNLVLLQVLEQTLSCW